MTELDHEQLMASWPLFCAELTPFLQELGLDNLNLEIDHTALRVNHREAAEQLSRQFAQDGTIISRNIINGRPIEVIELNTPLIFGQQYIQCVELPYPTEKRYPIEGWEHIELVLDCGAKTCDELVEALAERVPSITQIIDDAQQGLGDIKIKLSSPKGEHERLPNPTIAFKRGNLCVKVHPQGIKAVIASEQAS